MENKDMSFFLGKHDLHCKRYAQIFTSIYLMVRSTFQKTKVLQCYAKFCTNAQKQILVKIRKVSQMTSYVCN